MRDGESYVPTGEFQVESGDRVIIFTMPGEVKAVEEIFSRL